MVSNCLCSCVVVVDLIPLGNGCGIEFVGGSSYSVGSQFISLAFTDPCCVLSAITVNDETTPVGGVGDDGCCDCGINTGMILNASVNYTTGPCVNDDFTMSWNSTDGMWEGTD